VAFYYWLKQIADRSSDEKDWAVELAKQSIQVSDAEKIQHLANATRLLLFTEPGSAQEEQAMHNLAYVMSVYIDVDIDAKTCKQLVLSYKPDQEGLLARLKASVSILLKGRLDYRLLKTGYLSEWG
jgi:hypothetical protein